MRSRWSCRRKGSHPVSPRGAAEDCSELRCHLCRRRTRIRSCAGVPATLVRSIRRCSWHQGRRHRWNVAGRLLGYPLLADGDIAFLDFFLLHDLNVGPGLQLLVMNCWALRREIEVGRCVLRRRIGSKSGRSAIFGNAGGAACDHQHQGCGNCQSSLVFQAYPPSRQSSQLRDFVNGSSTHVAPRRMPDTEALHLAAQRVRMQSQDLSRSFSS